MAHKCRLLGQHVFKRRLPSANDHALPKGNAVTDILGLWFGIGIIPRGVRVIGAVHMQAMVARLSLPRADGRRGAWLEKCCINGVSGKVVVAFDHDSIVAAGDY